MVARPLLPRAHHLSFRLLLRIIILAILVILCSSAFCFIGSCAPRHPRILRGSRNELVHPIAMSADTKLYEVLGVAPDASVREIKKAYYKEARAAHPDLVKGAPNAEELQKRFQEVADAYSTLADPVRRQSYDLQGLAALSTHKTDASRLFGPPPWRVLIGCTDHYFWADGKKDYFLGLVAESVPNGIAGVTMKTIADAYEEAKATRVAVLLDRVSEQQAKDTVEAIEEFGLAVKAEPIEDERLNEEETPLMYFRRIQRELGEASQHLIQHAQPNLEDDETDSKFEYWIDTVRSLRSELRAAAKGLQEWKEAEAHAPKAPAAPAPVPEEKPPPAKVKKPTKEEREHLLRNDPPVARKRKEEAPVKKATKEEREHLLRNDPPVARKRKEEAPVKIKLEERESRNSAPDALRSLIMEK